MGGRYVPMMKHAGYDAMVIRGKAPRKVWISVINDKVEYLSADTVWGLDTQETQENLMPAMLDDFHRNEWNTVDANSRDAGRTTQRPAMLTTGLYAENYGPLSARVSDMAHVLGKGDLVVFGHIKT